MRPFNHAGPRQSPRYVLARPGVSGGAGGSRSLEPSGSRQPRRDSRLHRRARRVRGYRLLGLRGPPGEVYNLGSGSGTQDRRCAEYLRSLARVPIEIHVDSTQVRPVDQPMLVADASKLLRAVGWEPRYSIEETLADMLDAAGGHSAERQSARYAKLQSMGAAGGLGFSTRSSPHSRTRLVCDRGKTKAKVEPSPAVLETSTRPRGAATKVLTRQGPVRCRACRTGSRRRSGAGCRSL